MPEHLARYRAADLCLDTFPYGSHTTGSDALFVGCPFIGIYGETFASRVSLSLLRAAGLGHYATPSISAAAALAAEIATDAEKLATARRDFAAARTSLLFDPALFARNIEAGLAAAIDRDRQGLLPVSIDLTGSHANA